ncbi:MAG: DUF4340 domain-containing protein [Candidatus Omnitrophota bacterium]|jgi:hypothetical protein
MKITVSAVFLLLFIAVLGCYVLLSLDDWQSEVRSPRTVQSMQLLPLKDGDVIRWIQIQNAAKNLTVTLESEEGVWKVRYPVASEADALVVEGLVTALKLSTKARRFTAEKDWEEYGLLKPTIKVGIETRKHSKRKYLCLGDVAPTGNFIYARWEGENEYFLLQADLKNVFDQTLYGLRMKRVFRIPLKDLDKIVIRNLSAAYELSKVGEGWYWVEPLSLLGEAVDKKDVDYVFSQIERMNVKDFLDGMDQARTDPGFSAVEAYLKIRSGRSKEELLRLGRALPPRDAYYAVRSGAAEVFLVSKSNLDNFFQEMSGMVRSSLTRQAAAVAAAP